MTLGTNANLEELIKYSPQEIDFDFILAELKELEEWRELLVDFEDSPKDVQIRIDEYENDLTKKDRELGRIEFDLCCSKNEIERLKETIENLTASD